MTPPATVDPDEVDAYWSAVVACDEVAAMALARQVRDRGVPVDDVLGSLVVTAQRRVGDLWWHDFWSVVREHAATAINEEVVHHLGTELPPPDDRPRLLMACVEREWHSLPALIVAVSLRSWGHRVDHLGANASREKVISHLLDTGPRAVLLSATLGSSLPRVRRMIEAVRGTGTPVVVGGRAFDSAGFRARRLGATAYATGARQVEQLLPSLPHQVGGTSPLGHRGAVEASVILASADDLGRDAWATWCDALGLGRVTNAAGTAEDWAIALADFVPHVVDCLAGSLITDDPTVLSETRIWLTDMVAARSGDPAAVPTLWRTLSEQLGDRPLACALLRAA